MTWTAATRLTWKREKPGIYTAGPYRVQQIGSTWWTSGPSNAGPGIELDTAHLRKDHAQDLCAEIAVARANNPEVQPVKGDVVIAHGYPHTPRGRIAAIIQNSGPAQKPIYCIRLNIGGGRRCLFRNEFQVVLP